MKRIHEINCPGGVVAFQTAIDDYELALTAHKTSEGVPAPQASPEVMDAARLGVGNWEYVPTPTPTFEPVLLTYKQKRANEYPPLGDVVDAMAKALEGDSTEFNEVQVKRKAIKIKYPKPT